MTRSPKYTILAASLSLRLAVPAAAQDDRSPQEWLRLATEGDAQAQANVCEGYLNGNYGFEKRQADAFPFCVAVAEATGNAATQQMVGALHEAGIGTPEDYAAAARWYRRAADQGDADAQHRLGIFYGVGRGEVSKDPERAIALFRQAAEQGHAPAQADLGHMYHQGLGTDTNLVEARAWYERAAAQDDATGLTLLGNLHYRGLGGLPEDHARAAELYRRAADMGHAPAQANLAHLLEHGDGVPKDIEAAKRLYKQASEQGDLAAALNYRRLDMQ
ncbi:tetratricopeptide repeat protein [Salibaculum halophilum]|uniref:tetratricopeptide repeat protein n=1 Tax=Salibaculum halophilum TaxID=1914408 RepID=UPI0015C4B528|nr:tetratricopeptide repeat protein [Salibaculum halophilum]